jgi:pyridoxine 5'-phosphate synthase PdxJ
MTSVVHPYLRVVEGNISRAELNAGVLVLPGVAKRAITVVDAFVRAIGGAVTANTSVDIVDSVTGTVAVSFAQAQLTENAILRAGATGATATNLGLTLGTGEGLKVINVGTAADTVTTLDYQILYIVEAVDVAV